MSTFDDLGLYAEALQEALRTHPEGSAEAVWEADRIYTQRVAEARAQAEDE